MFEFFLILHEWITYWLTLFSALLVFFNAQGQETRFRVIHFDETTGLQTTIINCILQDKTGYMWFGTGDGLYRYDGYTFQAFKKIIGKAIVCRITLFKSLPKIMKVKYGRFTKWHQQL